LSQEAAIQGLIAEIQDEEMMARIEQQDIEQFIRNYLNTSLDYLQDKFVNPTTSWRDGMAGIEAFNRARATLNNNLNYLRDQFLTAEASSAGIKTRLGSSLNRINNYAQSRLSPSRRELATVSQTTWKGLLGSALNDINEYAQNKLTSPRSRSHTFRGLTGTLLNSANNFIQHKLTPKEMEAARIEQADIKELLANLFEGASDYVQNRLTPKEPEATRMEQVTPMDVWRTS
jgi:hypothetical protein